MMFLIFICLFAGIAATAVMTVSVNIISSLLRKKYYVIPILGTMLTGQTTSYKGLSYSHKSIYTGTIVHYMVGCFFSFWFYKLSFWYGGITFLYALLFGFAVGFIATAGWRVFFYVHSRPPRIEVNDYLKLIFASHIIFSMILLLVYSFYNF